MSRSGEGITRTAPVGTCVSREIDWKMKTPNPTVAAAASVRTAKGNFAAEDLGPPREISFCRADGFTHPVFDIDAEKFSVKSLENTKSASRV